MKDQVCRLDFKRFSNPNLQVLSEQVAIGVYENTNVFTAPTISEANYKVALETYRTTFIDYKAYGRTRKVAFLDARTELLAMLNVVAAYVNTVARGNESIIYLSGFSPTKAGTERAPQLDKITNIAITVGNVSGKAVIDTPAIVNKGVASYGLICIEGKPMDTADFVNGQLVIATDTSKIILDSSKSRIKTLVGLVPGMQYFVYMYASNASGVSPLSSGVPFYSI
jgi:hypothetical protein